MRIKTAGDLRGFLADVMIGIRAGSIDSSQAMAISKVAAQINQSLSVEVNTALQLERMGKDAPVAGSMLIGRADGSNDKTAALAIDQDGLVWCDQCDGRISPDDATTCKSRHCPIRSLVKES